MLIDRPVVRWAGTAFQIAGAMALASRTASPAVAYVVMLLGAAIWLSVSIHRRDWALTAMMGAYVAINVLGLLLWTAA